MAATLLGMFTFTFVFGLVLSTQKIWLPNTNFDSASNWNLNRVPCSKDRAVIPLDADVSVIVKENIGVRELILPINGEIILPVHGEIHVGAQTVENCIGKDNLFVGANRVYHWYDPANWKLEKDSAGFLTSDIDHSPVPHAEKVPCPSDGVVFPSGSSFLVYVKDLATTVGSFKINGRNMDSASLASYLGSVTGRKQFKVNSSLSLGGPVCSHVGGCRCDNDRPDVMHVICAFATQNGCPVPSCADPIVPAGSCCAICGSTMTVAVDEYFTFKKLKDFYVSYLQKPRFQSVSGYMSRTFMGKVQAVFQDESRLHRSKSLVEELEKSALKDEFQRATLNIVSYKIETTTDWSHIPATFSSMAGMSTGGWVALVFGLLSAAVIGILFFIQRNHLIPLTFTFGRFENEYDRDGGLDLGVELARRPPKSSSGSVSTESDVLKGLDNPYYDVPGQDSKPRDDTLAMGQSYETQHTRQNPCYMAFERVEDIPSVPEHADGPKASAE